MRQCRAHLLCSLPPRQLEPLHPAVFLHQRLGLLGLMHIQVNLPREQAGHLPLQLNTVRQHRPTKAHPHQLLVMVMIRVCSKQPCLLLNAMLTHA